MRRKIHHRTIEPELLVVIAHIEAQKIPLKKIAKRCGWGVPRIYKYVRRGGIKLSSFTAMAEAAGLEVQVVPKQVA